MPNHCYANNAGGIGKGSLNCPEGSIKPSRCRFKVTLATGSYTKDDLIPELIFTLFLFFSVVILLFCQDVNFCMSWCLNPIFC